MPCSCRTGATSNGNGGAAPKLPRLSMPGSGSGRQQGGSPQDSARRAPSSRATGATSPQSPGVLYVD